MLTYDTKRIWIKQQLTSNNKSNALEGFQKQLLGKGVANANAIKLTATKILYNTCQFRTTEDRLTLVDIMTSLKS